MKKIIFTILSFCFVYFQSSGQHCSTPSESSVCISLDTATTPGFAPPSDSLTPLYNGTSVSTVIQFENFDTTQGYTVFSLKIDSIGNLPGGLCWASNVPNDSFGHEAYGCIKLSGTVCAPPGQYQLYISVTANIGSAEFPLLVPVTDSQLLRKGIAYYIRVNNQGDTTQPIDSTGQSGGIAHPFKSYGEAIQGCTSGISEVGANINTLSIYPNPFSSEAIVSFNSDKVETMTEKLTNILGSEVYSKNMGVTMGINTHTIERGNLSPGVYFYTISDGKSVYTKRLIITE